MKTPIRWILGAVFVIAFTAGMTEFFQNFGWFNFFLVVALAASIAAIVFDASKKTDGS